MLFEARKGNVVSFPVKKVRSGSVANTNDDLAAEEPLEIRLSYRSNEEESNQTISVTMRTPGNDFELAAGFLFGEGIISSHDDIESMAYCTKTGEEQHYNKVNVRLSPWVKFDPATLKRNFYMSSSCGVCGKASIDSLQVRGCKKIDGNHLRVKESIIVALPGAIRKAQAVFERTGGLHASGLFESSGKLLILREDVGRHNALDKLIGSQLLANKMPLSDYLLLVSGRTSFEIVQKALVGGIPMVVGVGAPSSLAVELATEFDMTLIGFAKSDGFNVYSSPDRVVSSA